MASIGQVKSTNRMFMGKNLAMAPVGKGADTVKLGTRTGAEYPDLPGRVIQHTPDKDTRIQLKQDLVAGGQLGIGTLTDADIQYTQDKMEQAEYMNFLGWIQDNHPRGTIADAEHFKQLVPDWYEQRMLPFEEKIEVYRRLGRMKIYGANTLDDWALLYSIYTGRVIIPDNWEKLIDGPYDQKGGVWKQSDGIPGLFSPATYLASIKGANREVGNMMNTEKLMKNLNIPGFSYAAGMQGTAADPTQFATMARQRGQLGQNLFTSLFPGTSATVSNTVADRTAGALGNLGPRLTSTAPGNAQAPEGSDSGQVIS